MNFLQLDYVDIALAALLLFLNAGLSVALRLGIARRLLIAGTRMAPCGSTRQVVPSTRVKRAGSMPDLPYTSTMQAADQIPLLSAATFSAV